MKKLRVLSIIFIITLLSSISVFADTTEMPSLNKDIPSVEIPQTTRIDGYYVWKIVQKSRVSNEYGSWRYGPSGYGKGTITLTDGTSSGTSVTNTISGSYTSIATISASLGVSINESASHSVSYSHSIPAGQHHQIIYRPCFVVYKVVEKQYYVDHGSSVPTGDTKTCYVRIWINWDYSWRNI